MATSEEQKRFGLQAFLTKIPSPRRKQRTIATTPRSNKDDEEEEDVSMSGYFCPYVSPNSKTPPQRSRLSSSDSSVSTLSSSSSSVSSFSSSQSRGRKATLRSLFQRQSKSSQENHKNDDNDDDTVSLLLAKLPLEQQNSSAGDDPSDWNHSWRESENESYYYSINGKFHTSQSTLDPDISLLFFSSNEFEEQDDCCIQTPDVVLETPQKSRRTRKSSGIQTPSNLPLPLIRSPGRQCRDEPQHPQDNDRPPSSRRPHSPRRRRQTRPRTRVKHASRA